MFGLSRQHPSSSRVNGVRARQLIATGARLVDVRTAGEFLEGHIEGAINVPLQVIETGAANLGDKQRSLVVYCRSGGRSARARRYLENLGYTVFDLGSVGAW